jgi:hypothetical protein
MRGGRLHVVLAAHVTANGQRSTAASGDFGDEILRTVPTVEVVHAYGRAFTGKRVRYRRTDPSARPSHECDPSGKSGGASCR